MKAVLVLNGPVDADKLADCVGTAAIMAVDGGLVHVHRAGLTPRWILGDFDSVAPELLASYRSRSEIIRHPVAKDYTDMELAIDHLLQLGVDEIIAFGLQGGMRIDHQLTGWLLLAALAARGIRVSAWTQKQHHVFTIVSQLLLSARGRHFSLQALLKPATVSIDGARYSGYRLQLIPGSGFGLGNSIAGAMAAIKLHRGCVCISQWEGID